MAGESQDGSSVSLAVSVTVTVTAAQGLVATTTTISASSTQVLPSQSITFTAVVAPQSGSKVPTGTATFLDGSPEPGYGAVGHDRRGHLNLASLPLGTHSISAADVGDANDSPSTSAVLTVTVAAPEYAMCEGDQPSVISGVVVDSDSNA